MLFFGIVCILIGVFKFLVIENMYEEMKINDFEIRILNAPLTGRSSRFTAAL